MEDNLGNLNLAALLDSEKIGQMSVGGIVVSVLLIIAMWKILTIISCLG